VCQQGLTNLVCGAGGVSCANCLSMYMVCSNQQCATPPEGTPCGPSTCQGCCDDTGMCGYGDEDTACGKGGNRCADCTTPRGGSCSGGYCLGPGGTMPCSETCQGCCDAQGNCQAGFANSQCGGLGATCEDCTALSPASTCDTAGSSPICAGQEAQCSAAYAGCPAALEELAPVVQNVCSTDDLQNAAVACSAGATSDTCSAFFQAESTIHSPCGNCLQPFDFDFATQSGIFACVAPYVSATCNHSTACLVDCITQSCYRCPDSAACAAQAPSTSCSAYAQAGPCVTQALGGPAALCDPSTYQGNFGAWLAAVGAKYCGP
jgi:hypothetical protein